MKDKDHNNPNGIVVENVARGYALRMRLQKLWKPLTVGIVVVALAGGGWYWWAHREKPQTVNINPVTRTTADMLRDGSLNPSDPASQAKLEAAARETAGQEDKALVYDALATNAEARNDHRARVDSLIRAYEAGANDSGMALEIADTYENNLQDYNNALKYYRLALQIAEGELSKGDPYANGQIRYAKESIARMEAKGAR